MTLQFNVNVNAIEISLKSTVKSQMTILNFKSL